MAPWIPLHHTVRSLPKVNPLFKLWYIHCNLLTSFLLPSDKISARNGIRKDSDSEHRRQTRPRNKSKSGSHYSVEFAPILSTTTTQATQTTVNHVNNTSAINSTEEFKIPAKMTKSTCDCSTYTGHDIPSLVAPSTVSNLPTDRLNAEFLNRRRKTWSWFEDPIKTRKKKYELKSSDAVPLENKTNIFMISRDPPTAVVSLQEVKNLASSSETMNNIDSCPKQPVHCNSNKVTATENNNTVVIATKATSSDIDDVFTDDVNYYGIDNGGYSRQSSSISPSL